MCSGFFFNNIFFYKRLGTFGNRKIRNLSHVVFQFKAKTEQLEEEYRLRLERSHERLLDAQNKEASIRELMIQSKNDAEEQLLQLRAKTEEENNNFKAQQNSLLMVNFVAFAGFLFFYVTHFSMIFLHPF